MGSEDGNGLNEDNKIRARTVFPGSNKVIDEYKDGCKVTYYNKPDPKLKEPTETVKTAEGFIVRKGGVQSKEFVESLRHVNQLDSGGIQTKEFTSEMKKKQDDEKQEQNQE